MMNAFHGIGRITEQPQTKKTNSGKTTLTFTLAIDKRNKKKLEEAGEVGTNFIRCVAWDQTAATIESYVNKGYQIGINGSVETRTYKDQEGRTVYVTEILVGTITLLDNKRGEPKLSMNTVDDYRDPHDPGNDNYLELPF